MHSDQLYWSGLVGHLALQWHGGFVTEILHRVFRMNEVTREMKRQCILMSDTLLIQAIGNILAEP